MRLICPNCGAQYEVDDAVIPDQGRDVQCSNCGHTWFQRPAHLDAELAEELEQDLPADPPGADVADDAPDPEDGSNPPTLERRGLDPDVANVLREEAERDAELRRADSSGLETQPDLGLEDAAEIAASRSAAARARMARLRGLEENDAEAAAAGVVAAGGSRRELLPDVEEINSTLRASDDRSETGDEHAEVGQNLDETEKRGGSRVISRLILFVVILGIAIYIFAPQIIETIPQSEPYLVQYVEWANGVRSQINAAIGYASEQVLALIERFTAP